MPEKDIHRDTVRRRSAWNVLFGRGAVIVLLLLLQLGSVLLGFFRLQQYSFYVHTAVGTGTAVFLAHLLNTRQEPTLKLTWCIIIALVPVFGILLYLFISLDLGHRWEQKVQHQMERESAQYIEMPQPLIERIREREPGLYNLARYAAVANGYPAYENTAVTYFPTGEAKFEELLRQLEKAKRFIFLEYFIIEEGYMWAKVLDILQRKVREGVDVRVLYDGTCSILRLPYSYPRKLETMGISCRVFAPIRPFISTAYNNRDHRKIAVIDGRTAFTGGVNLADEYINMREKFGRWKDAAIMLRGDAVRSMTVMFLRMWNMWNREHVYEPYLTAPSETRRPELGYVIPYGDSPMDSERTGERIYLDILASARDYVHIMTPYLIIDSEMTSALTFAARRGVDVRLILPGIPDKRYANILAKGHYRELMEAGVKIYEYTPGFIHSKVFVSDEIKAVVGTVNLDYRSLYLHFECAVYLYRSPAVADVEADFETTLPECHEVTEEDLKKRRLASRLAGAVLKLAAPLM